MREMMMNGEVEMHSNELNRGERIYNGSAAEIWLNLRVVLDLFLLLYYLC